MGRGHTDRWLVPGAAESSNDCRVSPTQLHAASRSSADQPEADTSIEITTAARFRWTNAITGHRTKLALRSRVDTAQHNTLSKGRHPTTMTVDVYARQAFSGRNTSTLPLYCSISWNQRCDHKRFDREERYPQAGPARLAHRP